MAHGAARCGKTGRDEQNEKKGRKGWKRDKETGGRDERERGREKGGDRASWMGDGEEAIEVERREGERIVVRFELGQTV